LQLQAIVNKAPMAIARALSISTTGSTEVGHWTLDNAANNGTFMEELERLLHQHDINFDHMDRRIMCSPHVINICCQHILTKFTNVNLVDISGVTALPSSTSEQSFEEAVSYDPISRGQNVVHVLQSFGQPPQQVR
jgi:hypothetical protein